jgi:hypothetical protein
VGSGPSAAFSEAFDLARGLRQGCPLSCVLFNVFINDIFDDVPLPGCYVLSGRRKDIDRDPLRCHGLLFADDLVALASDLNEMAVLCTHVTTWCTANEMQVGIHKCGVMEFEPDDGAGHRMESVLPNATLQAPLQLCGQPVPLVETYTYLGIEVTKSLSYVDLIAPRLESGRKTVASLAPFLSCSIIPMSSRWLIVQVVVLPRLLHGAEIYGMCRDLTDTMQRHLNFALRCVLGIPRWRSMSSLLLWKEMQMKPICAIAASRQARAYSKCFGLKTWVNHLVKRLLNIRKWTWVSGTTRWIGRFCRPHSSLPVETWEQWWCWEPKMCKQQVEEAIMAREFGIRHGDGYRARPETKEYTRMRYELKPLVRARVLYDPALVTGLTWISRFRIKTVATTAQMFAWGKLTPYWTTWCPCCNALQQQEDVPHIFLECSRWLTHRQRYLSPLIRQIAELAPPVPFSRIDRLALILGGTTQGLRLPAWLPPRTDPYESDPESDDDTSSELSSSSGSASTRSSVPSVFRNIRLRDTPIPSHGSFSAAAFLTIVMRLRQTRLGMHPHWPLNSELPPIRTPGQRPAG